MKHFFTLFLIVFASLWVEAQTSKTITWDGVERQYLEYVPASYSTATPAPVLFLLHGLGDNMTNMFNTTGFRAIADAHGWIVITPQALEASISVFGQSQNIGTAWNSGVSANFLGTNIVVNADVDDAGFLMAILDELVDTYNVNTNNVFCTGFSMGGFMTNRMGIEHSDRFKAIASVSGTIGNEISSSTPAQPINTMHIHGTYDEMVSYDDAALSVQGFSISVGLGAEATVQFWRTANQCTETATTTNYPDIVSDNLTFERSDYEGVDNTKTVFIKAVGGEHTWYYIPANDIDYTTEIYNFFASFLTPTAIAEHTTNEVTIFPNPANNTLFILGENVANVRIYNALGQMMLQTTASEIPVNGWSEGIYTVCIAFKNGQTTTKKIVVQS